MKNHPQKQQPTPMIVHRRPTIREEENRPCYELFQQALVERSAAAWEQLYAQYLPLVLSWVQREPSFALSDEEAQDFANRAFEKMWRSITPTKFGRFATLPALLQYLRLCVRSVVIDQTRRDQQRCLELITADEPLYASLDVAEEYSADLQRREFWNHVQAHLKNEKERQLLYYRFVMGIKPNRICEQYGETFANPDEVYTMIQNILARLRRDPALQQFVLS